MKSFSLKLLQSVLVALAIFSCNICVAQIPNWNMENWSSTSDLPCQWVTYGLTTKVSPGQNGLYAIKLQADDLNYPGAVLYGFTNIKNDNNPGTPFNSRPDSMIAYFKYHISEGDVARVFITTKNSREQCSNDLYEYTGDNTVGYKRMAFKMHYTNESNPDTMYIGFTSTRPELNAINKSSWVILDNISFSGTKQNIQNPDFENWTSQSSYFAEGWQSFTSQLGSNIQRSSNAYAGKYAMKLQSTFNSSTIINGTTFTTGSLNSNNSGPSFPINSTPNSFKGFYKFIPQNGDIFYVNIVVYKNGQMIGQGNFTSPEAVNFYIPFSVPIIYEINSVGVKPDSASIQFATYNLKNKPSGQSIAYIDNLSFDRFIYAGIDESKSQVNKLNIYPNPTDSKLNVHFELLQKENISIYIYDINGSEILKLTEQFFDAGNHELNYNLTDLSCGIYFLVTQCGSSITHSKLMIVK